MLFYIFVIPFSWREKWFYIYSFHFFFFFLPAFLLPPCVHYTSIFICYFLRGGAGEYRKRPRIIGKSKMYMACCVKPPETYQSWQHSRDLHHTLYNILFSFYFSLPIIIIIISPRFCYTFESASNVSFLLSHPPCIFAPPLQFFWNRFFPLRYSDERGISS